MTYALYLRAMRGRNVEHICKRNVGRIRVGEEDRVVDGECRCQSGSLTRTDRRRLGMTDGGVLYSEAEHMDEWRMIDQPIGEDFAGEYLEVMEPQNIPGVAARL